MIENGMVMPTDVNFDRKRQRKVVFYGRVSTETSKHRGNNQTASS